MKQYLYFIVSLLFFATGSVSAQTTTQSLVFRMRVPGGSTQAFNNNVVTPGGPFSFSLTDNFTNQSPFEIGIGINGKIAVVSTSASGNKLITAPNGSNVWTDAGTPRARVDVTNTGVVWSIDAAGAIYSGTTNQSLGKTWMDVGAGPDGNVWAVKTDNTIWKWNSATLNWNTIAGATGIRIDGGPAGTCIIINTSNQVETFNGSSWANIGLPGGNNASDVSMGPNGIPWVVANNRIFSFVAASWLQDAGAPTGQQLFNLSVGPDNQPAATGFYGSGTTPLAKNNVFKRLSTGVYTTFDVDNVSSTIVFYNIALGTYSSTQSAVAGWSIANLYQAGAGSASTTNQNTGALSLSIEKDDAAVVEIVNVNCTPAPIAIGTICGSGYKEDFGTGAAPYGSPVGCGETTQLFLNNGAIVEDGQYSVVSNVSTGGNNAWVSGTDHTGNGNMMLINADYTPGVFFNRTFDGLSVGASYDFSAWIVNILKASVGGIPVNITFRVTDPSTGAIISQVATGTIANSNTLDWKRFALTFNATATTLKFELINNSPGGGGNDLALDDITVNVSTDHGDAPDSYGTSTAQNGPCHIATPSTLRMGALLDGEPDGTPTANANGDNIDNQNDEDGISTVPSLGRKDNTYSLTVSVHNSIGATATLRGWVDFNNNGTFDAGESVATTVANGFDGNKILLWTGITVAPMTVTYARLRLTTAALTANNATGIAPDGEVEDYMITVTNVLPVKLINFTAAADAQCHATLKWATAYEINTTGFTLQHSTNGINFTDAAFIACKNYATGFAYNFNYQPLSLGANFFRLKITDIDGKFDYSPVASLVTTCTAASTLTVTPNPTKGIVTIAGLTPNSKLIIDNNEGQRLVSLTNKEPVQIIDLSNFANGVYILQVVNEKGTVTTERIIKNN